MSFQGILSWAECFSVPWYWRKAFIFNSSSLKKIWTKKKKKGTVVYQKVLYSQLKTIWSRTHKYFNHLKYHIENCLWDQCLLKESSKFFVCESSFPPHILRYCPQKLVSSAYKVPMGIDFMSNESSIDVAKV